MVQLARRFSGALLRRSPCTMAPRHLRGCGKSLERSNHALEAGSRDDSRVERRVPRPTVGKGKASDGSRSRQRSSMPGLRVGWTLTTRSMSPSAHYVKNARRSKAIVGRPKTTRRSSTHEHANSSNLTLQREPGELVEGRRTIERASPSGKVLQMPLRERVGVREDFCERFPLAPGDCGWLILYRTPEKD